MYSNRLTILVAGLAIFALALSSLPAEALSLEDAEQKTEKLLARIASKNFDGLAEQMQKDDFFGTINPGLWDQLVTGVKQAYTLSGAGTQIHRFEKIDQKNLGSTLISNRYAILIGTQPMLFDVWLYKPNKDWQFLNMNFVFGTNAVELLKIWFTGSE